MTAVTAFVATEQSSTSSTYTDLATTTDTVTATVGASGSVLVLLTAAISSNGGNTSSIYASYALSGATTRAADDAYALISTQQSWASFEGGTFILETGLTPGSTTFKMKYRCNGGGATFSSWNRRITVIPLEDLTTQTAAAAYVATTQTTTTTSYTDLTTTTDQVTVTIGSSGLALVLLNTGTSNSTNDYVYEWTGYEMSGSNTRSADDDHAINYYKLPNNLFQFGGAILETGLAAGSTTFKMKYKTTGYTGQWFNRRIAVIPF